jgi:hypothetical protein
LINKAMTPSFGPAIGAGEEVVLGTEFDWSDGALDSIRVDFDAAVLEEPCPLTAPSKWRG